MTEKQSNYLKLKLIKYLKH